MPWIQHEFVNDPPTVPSIESPPQRNDGEYGDGNIKYLWLNVPQTMRVFGQVLMIDKCLAKKTLLYLADGHDVGVVVCRGCLDELKVGDCLCVEIDTIVAKNEALYTKIDVCTVVTSRKVRKSKSENIKSNVLFDAKNVFSLEDAMQTTPNPFGGVLAIQTQNIEGMVLCYQEYLVVDKNGKQAHLKLNVNQVKVDAIQPRGTLLLLYNGSVKYNVHSAQFDIYLMRNTLIQIGCSDSESDLLKFFDNTNDAGVVDDEKQACESMQLYTPSIREVMDQIDSMPKESEAIFTIPSAITDIAIGKRSIVHATCPECKKKMRVDEMPRNCPHCRFEASGHSSQPPECFSVWKLFFWIPLELSDHSGTWKGLFINNEVSCDVFSMSPESFVCLSTDQKQEIYYSHLFKEIKTQIHLYRHKNNSFTTKIMQIDF